ncbi:MAG: ComF family protein [Bacteroidaceae bacterium]|nr:ComF family protein [Bacteroidaceae bacterium]
MSNLWRDVVDMLLPRTCPMCGNRLLAGEPTLCTNCMMQLPFTDLHKVEHGILEKKFWGLFPVERAVAMFHHDGERTRHILYHIKYWKHPQIATDLASYYAEELLKTGFFDGIGAIIPLPLHWRKQWQRHYNQSHYIAQGISRVTSIPVFTQVVRRVRNNPSQTHLTAHERVENVKDLFRLIHPEKIAGKHILLVDDVVTTGATLTACAQELAKAASKISVLTLAIADRTALPAVEGDGCETSVFGIPLME